MMSPNDLKVSVSLGIVRNASARLCVPRPVPRNEKPALQELATSISTKLGKLCAKLADKPLERHTSRVAASGYHWDYDLAHGFHFDTDGDQQHEVFFFAFPHTGRSVGIDEVKIEITANRLLTPNQVEQLLRETLETLNP